MAAGCSDWLSPHPIPQGPETEKRCPRKDISLFVLITKTICYPVAAERLYVPIGWCGRAFRPSIWRSASWAVSGTRQTCSRLKHAHLWWSRWHFWFCHCRRVHNGSDRPEPARAERAVLVLKYSTEFLDFFRAQKQDHSARRVSILFGFKCSRGRELADYRNLWHKISIASELPEAPDRYQHSFFQASLVVRFINSCTSLNVRIMILFKRVPE